VLWRMAIILKANKVNLFVSSVLFFFPVPFTDLSRHTTYNFTFSEKKNFYQNFIVDNEIANGLLYNKLHSPY
jgi:hypothetical protein